MGPAGTELSVRLFHLLLGLFPRGFREEEREAAVETLRELLESAPGNGARVAVMVRAFGRLPGALMREWWDTLAGTGSTRSRAGRRRGGMGGMGMAVRQAFRGLTRNPGFAWTAVLLVALGVGTVTSVFTIVDHVLLRPLPYPDAERLVFVQNGAHSGPIMEDFRTLGSVGSWGAAWTEDVILSRDGEPLRLSASNVDLGFFRLFGARTRYGRLFTADDYPSGSVALLSWGAWQTIWGANPQVVGESILLDGVAHTVVGILAEGFEPPEVMVDDPSVEVFRPLDETRDEMRNRGYNVLSVTGLLRPGATAEAANAEMVGLLAGLAQDYPQAYQRRDGTPRSLPVTPLKEVTVGGVRTGLTLLLGGVALLLLVACANVAHLFLARGLSRIREMSVRRALGAAGSILARQLLVESLVLGVTGGLLGVGVAWLAVQGFLRWSAVDLPRLDAVQVDARVVAFAVALSALTAVVFGLLPALRAVRHDAMDGLRRESGQASAGRKARAVRSALVVAEVALSLLLVAEAGLLLRSFAALHGMEAGVQPEGVYTLPMSPTNIPTAEDWLVRMDVVQRSLSAVPGVQRATFALTMPLEMTGGSRCCMSTNASADPTTVSDGPRVAIHMIHEDYFDVLGIPLDVGSVWTRGERNADPRPAVLNQTLAAALFGSATAAMGRVVETQGRSFVVTGVVPETLHYGLATPHGPALYTVPNILPFPIPKVHFAVKAAGPVQASALRQAVWKVEPDLPVPTVRSMDDWITRASSTQRFQSLLGGAFGMVALLLAAGGLYGTLLYTVGQRKREMGIRLALGAPASSVQGMILRSGLLLGLAGAAVGVAGALAAGRFVESLLFQVQPDDPWVLAAAAATLLGTVLVASWVPARRAGRTDPVRTLKAE